MILAEVSIVIDFTNLEKYEEAVYDNEESFIELITSIYDYRPDMITNVTFSSVIVKIVMVLPGGTTIVDTIDNKVFLEWYNGLRNTSEL